MMCALNTSEGLFREVTEFAGVNPGFRGCANLLFSVLIGSLDIINFEKQSLNRGFKILYSLNLCITFTEVKRVVYFFVSRLINFYFLKFYLLQ